MIAHLPGLGVLRNSLLTLFCIGFAGFLWSADTDPDGVPSSPTLSAGQQLETGDKSRLPQRASAIFAGGCFWCMESDFERAPGVIDVISGYSGGRTKGPTYETYAAGGHREVIFVVYDPTAVTFAGLVEYLVKHIDPVNRRGQFQDPGTQYAPAIYYASAEEKAAAEQVIAAVEERKIFRGKLQVAIQERQAFWPAEDYHQNYHVKAGAKYQFYRMNSGRDAFVDRHWGLYANQLELPGAFPDTSLATNSVDNAPATGGPFAVSETVSDVGATTESAGATAPKMIAGRNEKTSVAEKLTDGEETGLGETGDAGQAWKKFKKPTSEKLQSQLTKMQFRVTQRDETEPAYANEYWDNHKAGIYVEVISGEPLFSSAAKFESGTGWPSFFRPIDSDAVIYKQDNHLLYTRIEVRSRYGDSHLGHVFDDGPIAFGGKRFCMNSAALRFIPRKQMQAEGYGEFLPYVETPAAH